GDQRVRVAGLLEAEPAGLGQESRRMRRVLGDAMTGLVEGCEVEAGHRRAARASAIEDRGGARIVFGQAFGLEVQPCPVDAAVGIAAFTRLLIQPGGTRQVLGDALPRLVALARPEAALRRSAL